MPVRSHRRPPLPPRRVLAIAVAIALWAAAPAVLADGVEVGDLVLQDAWARATPGRAVNGAAYLSIHSRGKSADRLIAASTPVAERIEPHTHEMSGGVMRMRRVDGLTIPAGARVTFAPGGLHLMMMGLNAPLRDGDTFPLSLRFENAGETTVRVRVLGVGAKAPGGTDKDGIGHRRGGAHEQRK